MATTIKLKNSVTTTNAPSSLVQGEVAINITDKKVWVGNAATTPIQLLGDGGSASFTSIAFGAGTVSNPSITFTGDTNTGIYSPAADTIAFTEGGAESMRIDSSGNVGIGTSSPTARLTIQDATANDALRITQTGTGNALVVEDSSNPDSTPFVIDASGVVINGYTTTVATQNYGGSAVTAALYQQHGNSQNTSTAALFNWSSSVASPANLILNKSISNVVGTRGAITAANTDIGSITFNGDDGTNFIPAAVILAEVDGTPGTNDMPGRLVFSTTADGASTPTERMRIDSAGTVTVGNDTLALPAMINIRATNNGLTSDTANNVLRFTDSDGSTAGNQPNGKIEFGNRDSTISGEVAAYILSSAAGGSGGGDIRFATSADNSGATERMRIDSAGRIRFNGTPAVTNGFTNSIPLTGGTTSYSTVIDGAIQPVSTSGVAYVRVSSNTAANGGTPYTITNLRMYQARQGTFNADSTVTNQYGFLADSDIINATNNFGFYSNIASGTGRWNFYANGTAANYFAGTVQNGSTISVGNATPSTSGAGITFPATQSASSDANTLDDYEEGTWTPTVYGSTTAGTTTYTTQRGFYTKIGRSVTITFKVAYSAATGTGSLYMGGIPFISSALGNTAEYIGAVMTNNLNMPNAGSYVIYTVGGAAALEIYSSTDDAALQNAIISNESAEIWGTLTYFTA